MKRSLYIVLTAIAFIAASCEKKSPSVDPMPGKEVSMKFTCGTEASSTAKTTVVDGVNVLWSAGDKISVFNGKGAKSAEGFVLTGGEGTNYGTFEGTIDPSAPYYALYPYDAYHSINGSVITFFLPEEQSYAENSFAVGAMPAAGTASATGDIKFKNLCGVLKLQLKGAVDGMTVTRIELIDTNGEGLAGEALVDLSQSTPTAVITSAQYKLALNCADPAGGSFGVDLSTENAKEFWFVVPAGVFASGFDAIVYFDYQGQQVSQTLSTIKAQTIERGVVRIMPVITIAKPETITLSEYDVTIPYGESVAITVTSSNKWYLGYHPDQANVDPSNGDAEETVVKIANLNEDVLTVESTITFKISDEVYATLFVALEGKTSDIVVSPDKQAYDKNAGGDFNFIVSAGSDFTAYSIPDVTGVEISDDEGNIVEAGHVYSGDRPHEFSVHITADIDSYGFVYEFQSKASLAVGKISFYHQDE